MLRLLATKEVKKRRNVEKSKIRSKGTCLKNTNSKIRKFEIIFRVKSVKCKVRIVIKIVIVAESVSESNPNTTHNKLELSD